MSDCTVASESQDFESRSSSKQLKGFQDSSTFWTFWTLICWTFWRGSQGFAVLNRVNSLLSFSGNNVSRRCGRCRKWLFLGTTKYSNQIKMSVRKRDRLPSVNSLEGRRYLQVEQSLPDVAFLRAAPRIASGALGWPVFWRLEHWLELPLLSSSCPCSCEQWLQLHLLASPYRCSWEQWLQLHLLTSSYRCSFLCSEWIRRRSFLPVFHISSESNKLSLGFTQCHHCVRLS